MFAPKIEATPVPTKSSRVSQSELRWLHHQLRTPGIPLFKRPRPAQRSIPDAFNFDLMGSEIIDLTGDDSDQESQGTSHLKSRQSLLAHERNPPNDDDHPSEMHNLRDHTSKAISYFSPLPIRQRDVTRRREPSPGFPRSRQVPNNLIPSNAEGIFRPLENTVAWTNKRKESESAEEDDHPETWSVKRLRARKNIPAFEIGLEGDTIFADDPAEDLMESIEDDDGEGSDSDSDGEDYEVERVIAERKGLGVHDFLLKWLGYEELSWIRASNCRHCKELIADFRAVPRVKVVAEDLEAKELEEERVRRSENAARTKAPKPPKVKRSRVEGASCFEDLKTRKFAKRRTIVYDSQSDSEWGGIESDDNGGVFNNFSTTLEAATARTQSKTPDPGRRTTPRCDSDRLLSQTASPVLPNSRPKSQSREVIWIRETPINEATMLPENAGNIDNHIQRPRQTARMIWIRDTPDVDDEQTSIINPKEEEVDFARITPESTQVSSTPSAEASGSVLIASTRTQSPLKNSVAISSLTVVNTKTIVDMAEPSSSESGRVELFEAEIRRIVEATNAILKKQQMVLEAKNENQQVSYSTRRQREKSGEVRKRWGKGRSRKAERVSKDLKHRNKSKGKRRSSGRNQAELQAAMERKRTEAAIEAEVGGNGGRLEATKLKVHNMLNDALANCRLRAPPVATGSRHRQRSMSMRTKAFQAAREKERRNRQTNGPFRREIHADMNPYYVKSLVDAVEKSSKRSQNRPYRHPETIYGFNLSSDDLPLPSIEV